MTTAFIALDWGTTSLRAWRIDEHGALLERRAGGPGIMKVADGAFAAALTDFCGDWLAAAPGARVIASGMIGSKQGWVEAPYCPCPAGAADLAARMAHAPLADGRRLAITPGVSTVDPATGLPDVMRGEETQVFGALPRAGQHLAILPGTHSKWARVADGRIESFATYMTGEMYGALVSHTILGRQIDAAAPHNAAAFERGARLGLSEPQALLARLFSPRTLGLFGQLAPAAAASYLSGLLIGSEVGHALAGTADNVAPVLLGDPQLSLRYATVLGLAGVAATLGDAEVAATGLYRLSGMGSGTADP
jgi:2-dehydro-3-deoxygalactonokinase